MFSRNTVWKLNWLGEGWSGKHIQISHCYISKIEVDLISGKDGPDFTCGTCFVAVVCYLQYIFKVVSSLQPP